MGEMTSVQVSLNAIDKVKEFVNIVGKFDCDMDLCAESKRYVVDAKSIMGIFSLDLSRNLILNIHTADASQITNALSKFIIR